MKILETMLQSRKNSPKWTKNLKVHDVDKGTLVFFFNSFFVFHPEAKHRKHTKFFWDKTDLKMCLRF